MHHELSTVRVGHKSELPALAEDRVREMKTPRALWFKGEMTISQPSADIFTTPTFFHTPVRRHKRVWDWGWVGVEWDIVPRPCGLI